MEDIEVKEYMDMMQGSDEICCPECWEKLHRKEA
jgi:hypothetical protein